MLDAERGNIEVLQRQILQLQSQNLHTSTQVTQLESLVQSYEQKNFDLEEASIEMRCSVQFVLSAMPAISFIYFWQYMRRWCQHDSFTPRSRVLPRICASEKPPLPPKFKYAGVKPKIPPRKHKLQNPLKDLEPIEKKLKGVSPPSTPDQYPILAKTSLTEIPQEWINREKLLCEKIDVLQQDIDLIQERFVQERTSLMEMYEIKLGEKEKELNQSQQCQEEKRILEEKWNSLTNELDQFATYFGQNMADFGNFYELQHKSSTLINGVEEMDVATGTRNDVIVEVDQPTLHNSHTLVKLIPVLQSTLKDHLTRFEYREQQLLAEIDRLVVEMRVKVNASQEAENNVVTHLSEENLRLQSLLKDQEQVWSDLKQAQDENERLRLELGEKAGIRRKLEEMQRTESELRERLEDSERIELNLQSQLGIMKRKELKGEEKVQQLIHGTLPFPCVILTQHNAHLVYVLFT